MGNNTAFFAYVVANMAKVSEQLVVVCLAISQPFPLVVAISQERLLAFGADEVLHAPMLAQGGHNSALDRSPARTANRNAHTVMASTGNKSNTILQTPTHLINRACVLVLLNIVT